MSKQESCFYINISPSSHLAKDNISLTSGVKISILDSKIIIKIPFPSTESIFYKKYHKGIEISNDLRLLYNESDDLDNAGITSLLMLGSIVPPLTPFNKIKSLLPGFTYELDTSSLAFKADDNSQWSTPSVDDKTLSTSKQMKKFSDTLDAIIQANCHTNNPVVLFSGGVDSSIIASRLAKMGWNDTSLVHCSFGNDDPETEVARSIAKALNLPLDIVSWDINTGYESLTNAAELYRHPFCDQSCVPTYALTKSIITNYGNERSILDGTGADGAFGLHKKIHLSQLLYSVPPAIRQSIGKLYPLFNLWKTTGRFEYYVKLMRRSSIIPELANSIALNPLANIGFFANSKNIALVSYLCEDWVKSVKGTNEQLEEIPLLDIALICARTFSQKNFSPLISHNFQINYPFLDHKMVDLALSHANFWPGNNVAKNILKKLLISSVPEKLVYRKKSGFLAPMEEQFSHPVFIEHINTITDTNSPLYPVVNQKVLTKLIDLINQRKSLPLQTYGFLWGITFSNAWLTQVKDVSYSLKKLYIKNNI